MPLILSVSPNVMHFVPIFLIMRAWGERFICYRKGLKLWKKCGPTKRRKGLKHRKERQMTLNLSTKHRKEQ